MLHKIQCYNRNLLLIVEALNSHTITKCIHLLSTSRSHKMLFAFQLILIEKCESTKNTFRSNTIITYSKDGFTLVYLTHKSHPPPPHTHKHTHPNSLIDIIDKLIYSSLIIWMNTLETPIASWDVDNTSRRFSLTTNNQSPLLSEGSVPWAATWRGLLKPRGVPSVSSTTCHLILRSYSQRWRELQPCCLCMHTKHCDCLQGLKTNLNIANHFFKRPESRGGSTWDK